ncbi:MAG: hypothetical protein WKF87_08770 [Chryseolinea sp.]
MENLLSRIENNEFSDSLPVKRFFLNGFFGGESLRELPAFGLAT